MTRLLTTYDPKPIPDFRFDWCAWFDGDEERGCGYGATEADAIADLKEQMELWSI